MLPTSLLMELYDQQITHEEFERMLIVPNGHGPSYDPYKPIMKSPISLLKTRANLVSPAPTKRNTKITILRREVSPSEVVTPSSSPTAVSYWQDLEIYSSSSDEEGRSKSSLSWTSVETNQRTEPEYVRSKSYTGRGKAKYCSFCFHNHEKEQVYTSHHLRDEARNITCPALFEVVCRYCGATGADAHTPKYCPNRTYRQ